MKIVVLDVLTHICGGETSLLSRGVSVQFCGLRKLLLAVGGAGGRGVGWGGGPAIQAHAPSPKLPPLLPESSQFGTSMKLVHGEHKST